MKQKNILILILTALLCCGAMTLVDGVLQPGYVIKSGIKIVLFLLLPLMLSGFHRELAALSLFRFQKRGFAVAFVLGIGLYVLILGGYFLLRNWIDFSGIAGNLSENAGITKDNFLYVSLYISFANSLLEEFFFRGFLFTNLKKHNCRLFAYLFSALAFALYHTGMMIGWFDFRIVALAIAGLAAGGMIFNWLNEKMDTIYVSWLVHMFANFAINTIGFMLLA